MMTDSDIIFRLKTAQLSPFAELSQLKVLGQALWVLQNVKDIVGVKALSPLSIRKVLYELKENDLSENAIVRAFARGKDKIKCHKNDEGIYYEIMSAGRSYISELHQMHSVEDIQFFTGGDCWSDLNLKLPKIIERLSGDLCMLDPYYGSGTLYVLQKFGKHDTIRFLTRELGKREKANMPSFRIEFQRFCKEFRNVQFRTLGPHEEVHDRYMIAKDSLLIVGHGIKDIATKESFLVYLPHEKVKGLLPNLKRSFEGKWARAIPLTP